MIILGDQGCITALQTDSFYRGFPQNRILIVKNKNSLNFICVYTLGGALKLPLSTWDYPTELSKTDRWSAWLKEYLFFYIKKKL